MRKKIIVLILLYYIVCSLAKSSNDNNVEVIDSVNEVSEEVERGNREKRQADGKFLALKIK